MTPSIKRPIDDLDVRSTAVTGRSTSLFATDFQERLPQLQRMIEGKTLLLTGGAGFIATQTLKQVLGLHPALVVIADSSENGLAELVRTLRSDGLVGPGTRIEPRLVDITSPLVERMLDEIGPVDVAWQFAAAKHVRTERDVASLLRMLHVNLNGTYSLTRAVVQRNPAVSIFTVSTDKAADPSSVMGASKRLMEMAVQGRYPQSTSTRFANVAFSNGSLLESWVLRLRHGQPLAVPEDTWRYFVSPTEAGQMCAIAATAPAGSVAVPDEDATGLVDLQSALDRVLGLMDLSAAPVRDESELIKIKGRGYPVLVSVRDTAGEKRAEKFVGASEGRQDWLPNIGVVFPSQEPEAALEVSDWVADCVANPSRPLSMTDILDRIGAAIPEFSHISGHRRLDDRI
jgi:FlaA1/EpsC-like NDP-sugar epimerase